MFHHPNPIFVLACQEKESVFWVWKLPEQVQDLFIKCWQPWNRDLRHPRKRARCSSLALKTCQIDAAVQIGVHLELHVCPFGNFSERVGPSSRQFSSDAHTTTLWSWMTVWELENHHFWKREIIEHHWNDAMICHDMSWHGSQLTSWHRLAARGSHAEAFQVRGRWDLNPWWAYQLCILVRVG